MSQYLSFVCLGPGCLSCWNSLLQFCLHALLRFLGILYNLSLQNRPSLRQIVFVYCHFLYFENVFRQQEQCSESGFTSSCSERTSNCSACTSYECKNLEKSHLSSDRRRESHDRLALFVSNFPAQLAIPCHSVKLRDVLPWEQLCRQSRGKCEISRKQL